MGGENNNRKATESDCFAVELDTTYMIPRRFEMRDNYQNNTVRFRIVNFTIIRSHTAVSHGLYPIPSKFIIQVFLKFSQSALRLFANGISGIS